MYNKFDHFNRLKKVIDKKISPNIDLLKEKYQEPEVQWWRNRMFGEKRLSWNNLGWFLLRFLVWIIVFTVLLLVWFTPDLPTPNSIKNYQAAQATQLFDRNNKPIYTFNGDVRRNVINGNDMPLNLRNATIAAEDHDFYHHFGIDFRGLARAVYYDIFRPGSGLQGGSTITQQFVKNALLNPQRTIIRKIKEVFLSLEVEAMYSKDQILTMYLNEIPYGSNAYGIEAASQTFFNKHAKDLTLAEAATLAALPQRPTYFSPYSTHPDQRLARVDYILDSMVTAGNISKADADKAKTEAKTLKFTKPSEYIAAPHFASYVKDQLVAKFGEQTVDEAGLKVTTTLDLDKQNMAETAVKTQAANKFGNINATNAALVAIDPTNGQILSMVGSVDYFNNDIDGQVNVADSLRQPGSSFKPIVYATAFKDKYNPGYVLWDVPTDFGNYKPQNYDGTTHGPVTMRMALAGSLNIPAVKTLFLAGIPNSLQTAHDMGITTLNQPDRYGLSLVLGGGEVKLVDMVGAYGTFANAGQFSSTTSILKVEDSHGKVLLDNTQKNDAKQVIDPQIAYEISSILSDNNARSFVFGANSALNFSDRQVAVKTGTTSEYRDAWTIGYTPQLVAGVWVGNNDNSKMTAGAAGAMAAAPIWHNFMAAALASEPKQDFVAPAGITTVTVDKLSNKLPTAASPETITDIFADWQVPKTTDNIHQLVKIDKSTGNLATDDCPDAFVDKWYITNLHSENPTNPNWENPVLAAAEAFGIHLVGPNIASTKKFCSSVGNKLGVKITNLNDGDTVNSNFTVRVKTKSKVTHLDLSIDGQTISSSDKSPYNFTITNIAAGDHRVAVVAFDVSNNASSVRVDITVKADATPKASSYTPDNVSSVSVSANDSSNASLSWTNPGNNDLTKVNIYISTNNGDLGDLVKTISANPSSKSNIVLSGLQSGQTYWITLRAENSAGNENADSNQYPVTMP